jgi:hypothetical protein
MNEPSVPRTGGTIQPAPPGIALEREAACAFASFAADVYGLAVLSGNTPAADRLVDAYRRALSPGSDDAERYWFEFYIRLEAFVRTALARISPYSPATTRALIGFAEILDDDFGRRVRECAYALAPESTLP